MEHYESWLSVPMGKCADCSHVTPADRESGCPLCDGEVLTE